MVHWYGKTELEKLVADWAKQDERLKAIHSHLRQNVVNRVLEGTERWLEALKEGRKNVRPPKHKLAKHYRSFTFKQFGNGCRINNHRVFLSGFGWCKLHDHRRIVGRPTTATVKFMQGRWWCIVTAQSFEVDWYAERSQSAEGLPDCGGDPGLLSLLTLSDGRVFDPPRAFREAKRRLKRASRTMARKFRVRKAGHAASVAAGTETRSLKELPYSKRLTAAIRRVAKIHTKVDRIREYHHAKTAAVIDDTVGRLAVEEHGVTFMLRNRRLAASAADRAIAAFKQRVAATLGSKRYVPTANCRPDIGGNSQTCVCGHAVPKELSERVHACPSCGLTGPRDMVSANIVQMIAFGTVSEELAALNGGSVKLPGMCEVSAGGQSVDMRGGSEGSRGASLAAEPFARATSELSERRKSQSSFVRETLRVGNLPRKVRLVGNERRGTAALCPPEPKSLGPFGQALPDTGGSLGL